MFHNEFISDLISIIRSPKRALDLMRKNYGNLALFIKEMDEDHREISSGESMLDTPDREEYFEGSAAKSYLDKSADLLITRQLDPLGYSEILSSGIIGLNNKEIDSMPPDRDIDN